MRVVDASVAAKWFLPEHGTAAAQKLLSSDQRLIAPSIIRIEVAAAIVRGYRERRMTEAVARDCCSSWERLLGERIVQLIDNDELHELAVKLAFEIRHSVQDCLYLAAGKAMKASVLTADKTFADRGAKVLRNIRLIGENDVD